MNPSWDEDGLKYLSKLLSLSNLKRRWLIQGTKTKSKPTKVETIRFLETWIEKLQNLKNDIIKTRS